MDAETQHTAPNTPRQNIVLVGFMGCGKSTIGRELQKLLGYPLIDTDHAIESKERKKITDIFKSDGEDGFRKIETQFLEQLIEEQTNHSIVSTGGGIVTRPENIKLLRELGFVVWLACTPETILERTSRNNNRPLLQCDNPMKIITTMLAERHHLYEASSQLKINSSDLAIHEITYGILESARYYFSSHPSEETNKQMNESSGESKEG